MVVDVSADTAALVQGIAQLLGASGQCLVCAESCTGGLIAAACTALAGSSHWFDRGFVTYSNEAKTEMLGVDARLIERVGAVSEDVARAMAQGALQRAPRADWAIAVTGIAGPGGGTAAKPVGTVWFAWADRRGAVQTQCHHFDGDRAAVRAQTCDTALRELLGWLRADA